MIRIRIVGAGHIAADYMDVYPSIDNCQVDQNSMDFMKIE